MSKNSFFFLAIMAIVLAFFVSKNGDRHICRYGYLYWDWDGRPQFMCIPVLDKNGNMIECTEIDGNEGDE